MTVTERELLTCGIVILIFLSMFKIVIGLSTWPIIGSRRSVTVLTEENKV